MTLKPQGNLPKEKKVKVMRRNLLVEQRKMEKLEIRREKEEKEAMAKKRKVETRKRKIEVTFQCLTNYFFSRSLKLHF